MATNILRNNFTNGIVNPKLWGIYNSQAYINGCANLTNFRIMSQGGVTRRYPTTYLNEMEGKRIIPFVIDEKTSFLIEIVGGSYIRVYRVYSNNNPQLVYFNGENSNPWGSTEGSSTISDVPMYTDDEAKEIQYTQGLNDSMIILVLAHKNHSPLVFEFDPTGRSGSGIMYRPFSLNHSKAEFSSDGTETGEWEQTEDFLSPNDCPSVAFYYASRLWFASSINHPYRLWASRPFKPFNFQMVDWEDVVDDVTTSQDIIDKIQGGSEYEPTTIIETVDVIREDNALLLEVGSSKNDRIMWMSSMGNYIVVGTTSGEWLIAGTINGLTQSTRQASAYGSVGIQPVMAGNDLIFAQSPSKVRSYIGSDSGYSCVDLVYQCDDLLKDGIKRLVWKRVPDPILFCSMNTSESIYALFYDRLYSLSGWAKWDMGATVHDMCVIDTENGQSLFLLIERDSNIYLEKFDENRTVYLDSYHTDDDSGIEFESHLETNTYEGSYQGSTLGKKKRIYKSHLRVLDASKGKVGAYWGQGTAPQYTQSFDADDNSWGIDDVEVNMAGGYEKYVSFKVDSKSSEKLTIGAITMLTEVE